MNRNHLIGFVAAMAILALAAFALSLLFEIYPRTRYISPSSEASANEYLAMERWLKEYDIPVRTVRLGDFSTISEAGERHILIQVSMFIWSEEAEEYLGSWIREGGHLFLVMDINQDMVQNFISREFHIDIRSPADRGAFRYNADFPNYDQRISFEVPPDNEAVLLLDPRYIARLVQVKHGKGTLTVSGRPFFMYSRNLEMAPNARLAWGLLAADTAGTGADTVADTAAAAITSGAALPGEGWLFIRGNMRPQNDGILGTLFNEGNLAVLLVSLMVLLIVGFWAVIPIFGLVRRGRERPGKPLRERFLAEGRFIKRYGALDFYRDIYIKEINRRLARKGISSDKIEEEIRTIQGENVKIGDFPGIIKTLKTILERI